MIDTIHLVMASRGEYSDRVQWIVAAFRTEAEAIDCANHRNISNASSLASVQEYNRAAARIREELAAQLITPGQASSFGTFGDGNAEFIAFNPMVPMAQRDAIERGVIDRLGEHPGGYDPNSYAEDHTVISVPIGEIGRWDI